MTVAQHIIFFCCPAEAPEELRILFLLHHQVKRHPRLMCHMKGDTSLAVPPALCRLSLVTLPLLGLAFHTCPCPSLHL